MSRATGRIRLLSLAGLTVAVLAGCGSSASTGTGIAPLLNSGSTTGGSTAHAFTSATDERNKLLALAKPGTSVTAQGTIAGWPPANGSGIPATPSEISGFGLVVDKPKNLEYLSFTVMDTSGKCVGGDLETNSAGTQIVAARPITIPAKAPCTGDEAAKVAGHG